MTRPTDDIEWATDGGASVTEPPALKKTQGWIFAEKPPAAWLNWLLRALWRWIAYLDEETTASQLTAQRLWTMANAARLDHVVTLATTSDAKCLALSGVYGVIGAGGASECIWRSSNRGRSWALDTSIDAIMPGVYGLAFNTDGSVLAAVGSAGGTHAIAHSTDYGNTWTGNVAVGSAMYGVAHNGSLFVAVGDSGKIYTSTTGTSGWTSRTAAGTPANINFKAVCWSAVNSLFVAVGTDSTAGAHLEIQTSPDGITWTARTAAASTETTLTEIAEIDFGSTTYLIACGVNGELQYSTNATAWTQHGASNLSSAEYRDICQVPAGALLGDDVLRMTLLTDGTTRGSSGRFPEDDIAPAATAGWLAVGYSSEFGIVAAGTNGNIWLSYAGQFTGL